MAFIIDTGNGEGFFGVFEDDGDTGYLYLYEPDCREIVDYLHIYNYPKKIGITKKDVEVVWSTNRKKCGVKVWGKFYGIFDLALNGKIRKPVKDKDTPPITDETLLRGF